MAGPLEGPRHEGTIEKIVDDIVEDVKDVVEDVVDIVDIIVHGHKTYNQPVLPLVVILI